MDKKPKDDPGLKELMDIRAVRLAMLPLIYITFLSIMCLLAGGPSMFFSHLPGQVMAGLFALLLVAERLFQSTACGGKRRDQLSLMKIWATSSLTYLLAIVDWYWIQPRWSLLSWNWIWAAAGSGVFLAGLFLRVTAMRTLGKFFNIAVQLHADHRLIREGVYSRLRHPAYTGLMLIVLGFVTVFASPIGYLGFFVLTMPGLVLRIRLEEKALEEMFGDEYREYCRKARRLIPFIY